MHFPDLVEMIQAISHWPVLVEMLIWYKWFNVTHVSQTTDIYFTLSIPILGTGSQCLFLPTQEQTQTKHKSFPMSCKPADSWYVVVSLLTNLWIQVCVLYILGCNHLSTSHVHASGSSQLQRVSFWITAAPCWVCKCAIDMHCHTQSLKGWNEWWTTSMGAHSF